MSGSNVIGKVDTLLKRLNGFHVDLSQAPNLPQSAALDEDTTDMSYFSEVQLGSGPGETVYLLMDTGSSAAWVMGEGCTSTACKSHETFGSSNSKSLSQGSDTFNISYKSGNVAGPIVTDSVSLAGMSIKMEFGLAQQTSDNFNDYPMDGILGLARQPSAGFTPPTFIQLLQQQKVLKSNIFGMNLQRAVDNTNDGEVNFGSIDTTKFSGDLNYLSTIDDNYFWEIPVDGFSVNGNTSSLGSRSAIIDSGTSFIFLPPADAAALFQQIPGSKSSSSSTYSIPCSTDVPFSIVFNKVAYKISPKDYVGSSQGNGQCASNIFSQVAVDDQTWLLGDAFMKNVYTVFDMDQNRIGFGQKNGTVSSSNSSSTASASITSSAASTSAAGSAAAVTAAVTPSGIQPLLPGQSSSPTIRASASPSAVGSSGAQGSTSSGHIDVLPKWSTSTVFLLLILLLF